jgi:hypothetical protein
MAAGFEGDVRRRTSGGSASSLDGFGFGVGSATLLGPAAPDNVVVVDNDTADSGIGPDLAKSATR